MANDSSRGRASAGQRDLVAGHLDRVLGDDRGRYELEGNTKLPRAVDHQLETWGCVACNFCVTVCPNDAFFKIPTGGIGDLEGRQQYLLFSELCNDCGNCMTFCPEEGDPAVIKPRLYLDEDRFSAATGPRFLLGGVDEVTATPAGGADEHVGTLVALLNSDEGLPLPLETEGS